MLFSWTKQNFTDVLCLCHIIIMIRLQIAVSNLQPTNYQQNFANQISMKFGSIATSISIVERHGGKSLVLQLSQGEMQQIYQFYCCGLFIETKQGRYFSILSLERLKISDKVICQQIYFCNDLRQTKFKCQFSIVTNTYKAPKIADTSKMQQRQNALNMLKKPPIPKQNPYLNNFVQPSEQNKVPNSFLYGGKQNTTQVLPDNLKTMKQGLRKQNQIKKSLQQSKHPNYNVPQKVMAKQPQAMNQDWDLLDEQPPAMEFTNDQQPEFQKDLRVPQVQYIQYGDSAEEPSKQNIRNNITSTQPKFATFNRNGSANKGATSPETPSQFQLKKNDSRTLPSKPKTLSKQEIKDMARKQAQERELRDKMLIPIAKGDKFEMVPLSKLKPQQIIDYVHKTRKIQQEAQSLQKRKKKLEQQERQVQAMRQKTRKLQQQIQRREKQRPAFEKQPSYKNKKNSKELRESVDELSEQQQSEHQQQQRQDNQDDDYTSDFQSASVSNSAIKSRVSSRGANTRNIPKQQESIALQDEYSQQFESYSHSIISKSNKNKSKVPSISDYSDSYRSISQSYKR